MSNQINWLISNFYGALNISATSTAITKKTKVAGAYSDDVSTDTAKNLKTSTIKVGNAVRKAMYKTAL